MPPLQTLVIDWNNIIQGASLNDYMANAGYNPRTRGVNPLKTPGILYSQPPFTDVTTQLEGNVIASIPDPNFGGNDAYLLDNEGKFYTLNSSFATKRQTDSTRSYTAGTSDMIFFNGGVFATSTTNVAMLTGGDLSSMDDDWWTATRGHSSLDQNYRHPLEVVEDTMYIADKNLLHTWDGTTSVPSALVLPNIWNITALKKHPNGRDLIAFCSETANYSNQKGTRAVAFIINTVTLEFTQEIIIGQQVEGARVVGGIMYVTYGQNLGYFTETGIEFLRKLELTLFGGSLAYKHHLGDMDGHLLVVEGSSLLAFGDLGAGKQFWYPAINDQVYGTGQNIDNIIYIGSNKLVFGTQTSGGVEKLYQLDYNTITNDSGGKATPVFLSNPYSFPMKVWIRRIDFHMTTFATGQEVYVGMEDDLQVKTLFGSYTFAQQGAQSLIRFDGNYYTDLAKLYFYFGISGSGGIGIPGFKKATIYYEPAET